MGARGERHHTANLNSVLKILFSELELSDRENASSLKAEGE